MRSFGSVLTMQKCLYTGVFLLNLFLLHSLLAPFFSPVQINAQELERPDASGQTCQIGSPDNERWAPINEYDAHFISAAREFRVDGNLLKAMAWIESGGQGHINPATGRPWERDDGFGDGLSIGLMQVKPGIWQSLVPDADAYDPLGNIRLGAAIMAKAIRDYGSWERALTEVYFPADDPNGTTQQIYIDKVNQLVAELSGGGCDGIQLDGSGGSGGSSSGKSSCVITTVGNPKVSPTLPPGCTGRGGGPCQVPPEPYPTDLVGEIKSTWGISIIGSPTADQLRWIYEIFYAVSSTSFLESVKGSIVEVTGKNGNISYQVGCPGDDATDIELSAGLGETGIKGILIHELGHVYQICNENGQTNLSDIYAAYDAEGGISEYSRTGCGLSGINLYNEDHAETISLHLNPNLPSQACGGETQNPYADGQRFRLHKAVAVDAVGQYSCSL